MEARPSVVPVQPQNATQAIAIAVKAIFERWTALRLVVEHHFGGAPYQANQLLETTVAMATDPSKRHSVDDYIENFYGMFDSANTDIEDGSPEQVANLILRIRDAAANGNFAPAQEVAQRAGMSAEAFQNSIQGVQDSGEEDDPDYVPDGESLMPSQSKAVVDEDGFTEVVSRRRRR